MYASPMSEPNRTAVCDGTTDPPYVVRFNVWWEEDPTKTRTVVGACKVCSKDWADWELRDPMLVSPSGLIHHADEGVTVCGKDATGPEWWWRV